MSRGTPAAPGRCRRADCPRRSRRRTSPSAAQGGRSGRRLRLTMAEEPADHGQAVAPGERSRGEGVPEIVAG